MMEDIELIKRIIRGDKKAFDKIFEKYKEYTYRISYHILRNRDDAMDNVSNGWFKIYKALINKKFNFKSKFSTWIYKIIVNEALLQLKNRKFEISIDDPAFVEIPALTSTITDIDNRIDRKLRIEKIMKYLTPIQQQIIQLLLKGYTFKEIAEKLKIKPNYLYQLTSRIKKTLENL